MPAARLAILMMTLLALSGRTELLAQTPGPAETAGSRWRPLDAGASSNQPGGSEAGADEPGTALRAVPSSDTSAGRAPIARVTKGSGVLPNDHGQVWREYDITAYTTRVTTTARPEQALIDWILRETGYEAWHTEPLGILSADRRTLRVYHTPQMQGVVSEVVDRFVNSEAATHAFSLRVVSVSSPNWRAKLQRLLRPVSVQTQGAQAWLLAKEDASLLVAELRKRTDFREYSSPQLLVNNGQSTVVSTLRPRNYARDVVHRPEAWPGFEPELAQIDEGFALELNPLLSLDGRAIDAVIKCNLDQVEKMVPVMLDVPTPAAPRQRTQIDVPQMTSFRLQERFRWPTEYVLLVSCGVVATPVPTEPTAIRIPLVTPTDRAELLILVESRGTASASPLTSPAGVREAQIYRGRY